MPIGAERANRLKLIASGTFFFGYLGFQIVYPAVAWVDPSFKKFTWQMYSGLGKELRFTATFADGSRRETGNPQKVGSPIRVLGPSVDQRRFVPPWLCANWKGARSVLIRDNLSGVEEVFRCPAATL